MSKERGRGNFRFYQPQMNVDLLARVKMDHAMRQGMEQGLFRLHYQPQIALVRWRLLGAGRSCAGPIPELGPVSPAKFIPLAEESGFIIAIGNWVLQEAVRQTTVWQEAGTPTVVSVNVSALQVSARGLCRARGTRSACSRFAASAVGTGADRVHPDSRCQQGTGTPAFAGVAGREPVH